MNYEKAKERVTYDIIKCKEVINSYNNEIALNQSMIDNAETFLEVSGKADYEYKNKILRQELYEIQKELTSNERYLKNIEYNISNPKKIKPTTSATVETIPAESESRKSERNDFDYDYQLQHMGAGK